MIFVDGGGVRRWMWEEEVEIFKERYEWFGGDLIGEGRRVKEEIF
ncbi:hypothetical protein [Bacillus sp. WP8]|nr:hypothetical protein [Bacillus sp. WP8]